MKPLLLGSVIVLVLGQICFYVLNSLLRTPATPVLEEVCWGKEENCGKDDRSIRPFKINVSKQVLDDLHYRLKNAIIPEPIENSKQHYGFNGNTLKEVVHYWLHKYDWNQREAYLNKFPHFKTRIQGLDIHFIHIKPKVNPGTPLYPLLICHGWGGSIREFYDVIPILTNVHKEYGFAFEVVVPSLPGFIFSEATTKPGMGAAQMSLILRNLMLRLGHEKFYLHGGDWGSVVVKDLGTLFPENVLGLHCTLAMSVSKVSWMKFLVGSVFPRLVVSKEFEHQMYPISEKIYNFLMETGYYHIQVTKPDTVGAAIANSPVGLAAYLLEKFSTLANAAYKDRDDAGLLERIYYESSTNEQANFSDIPIDPKIPCAVARFPNEVLYQPDCILRDKFPNLIQSTDFNEGGHFAAMENGLAEPFAQDIFSAVNKMRDLSNEVKKI
ncbi:Jheh2 [Trypoxylus dichotomus]